MAIRQKDEILNAIKENFADKLEDEATISLIEDITDTLDAKANDDKIDWKKKYEENDKAWKTKYTNRFFNNDDKPDDSDDSDDIDIHDEPPKKYTFDELFKTE